MSKDLPKHVMMAKWKSRSRWASLVRIVFVTAMVVFVMRIFGCTERLAYFPSRDPFQTPVGFEDVFFQTPDGLTLHGWFLPSRAPAADGQRPPAVLHCHGNAGNVSFHSYFSDFLPDHGISVFLFDYRCFGRSDPGALRKKKLLVDAEAALDYLLTRDDIDKSRIGVYGVSLGGAFAMPLAARREEIQCLVTVSVFSTWRGAAADMLPVIGPVLFPGGLDPIDSVSGLVETPWLIMHGTNDRVINQRHAQILADEAARLGAPFSVYWAQGGDHNSIFDLDPQARTAVAEFILNALQ